ncbi:MAG TPA: hypothetical protein PLZ37_05665 [Nitrospira sp.]|nr:hypothetical protein [Nitrospira sp. NTP1]HQR14028.1 hypothetical protein [Nitrospira sp.]
MVRSRTVQIARALALAALISGCVTPGPAPRVIQDADELLVRLDPSEACAGGTEGTPFSHPIQLSGPQIRTLLGSLLAREKVGLLSSFVQAPGTPRLFDDADLDQLIPPIQQAFAQAEPEEAVVLLLTTPVSDSRSTVTSGALSIRGEVLSVALFNFRHPVRTTLADVGATDRLSDVRETLQYVRTLPCASSGEQDFALFFEKPAYQTQPRSGSLIRYPERTLSIAYRDFLATHTEAIRGERDGLSSPPNTASNRTELQAIADLKRRIAELERINQALADRTHGSPSTDAAGKPLIPDTDTDPPSPADTQTRLVETVRRLEMRVSELERRLGQDAAR